MSGSKEILGYFEPFISGDISEDVHQKIQLYARFKVVRERCHRELEPLAKELQALEKQRIELMRQDSNNTLAATILSPLGGAGALFKRTNLEQTLQWVDEQTARTWHELTSKQQDLIRADGEMTKLSEHLSYVLLDN